MPRPAKFSHATLRTHDLPRLRDWYKAVFDLEIYAESPRAVIGSYDEEHHRFALTLGAPAPGPDGRQQTTLKHLAYGYESLKDLLAQYEYLKELGIVPIETVNHGPTISFYYEDPDGNGVEFFTERFATLNECKDFMGSEPFQKNLFGYLIDPEEFLEQFKAGVNDDEIMRYDQELADRFLAARTQSVY